MTPTPRLRFVERQHGYKSMSSGEFIGNTIRVLQQWYAYDIDYPTEKGEWRDVPLEKEND
jgi:hypothetical protein